MPAVGALEGARVRRDRARERAALVAEKLALGEVGRDRAAVEDDERPAGSRALLVEPVGQHVLADAGLADERDGDVGAAKRSRTSKTSCIAVDRAATRPKRRTAPRRKPPGGVFGISSLGGVQ